MDKGQLDYFADRMRAEREAASAAANEKARAAHLTLAEEYRRLLAEAGHPAAFEHPDPGKSPEEV